MIAIMASMIFCGCGRSPKIVPGSPGGSVKLRLNLQPLQPLLNTVPTSFPRARVGNNCCRNASGVSVMNTVSVTLDRQHLAAANQRGSGARPLLGHRRVILPTNDQRWCVNLRKLFFDPIPKHLSGHGKSPHWSAPHHIEKPIHPKARWLAGSIPEQTGKLSRQSVRSGIDGRANQVRVSTIWGAFVATWAEIWQPSEFAIR